MTLFTNAGLLPFESEAAFEASGLLDSTEAMWCWNFLLALRWRCSYRREFDGGGKEL